MACGSRTPLRDAQSADVWGEPFFQCGSEFSKLVSYTMRLAPASPTARVTDEATKKNQLRVNCMTVASAELWEGYQAMDIQQKRVR